jgi:hypothetical protein
LAGLRPLEDQLLAIKLVLAIVLAVVPLEIIFVLPFLSPLAGAGVVGLWLAAPAWGPWVYAGVGAG